MVARARLVPPRVQQRDWPWHALKWAAIGASQIFGDERRLEADAYLSPGFRLRASIESARKGWVRLAEVASVWMPGRLKGIQVSREEGTPFLAATQVYDIRPVVRKWLALSRTPDAEARFVRAGMILVTCSGSVGRPTIANAVHEGVLISHDLLRVEPLEPADRGWVYAYLRSAQARAMATSAKYGHIIKHLEVQHLAGLPIPEFPERVKGELNRAFDAIVRLRAQGHDLQQEAEREFESALGGVPAIEDLGERGFVARASDTIFLERNRVDAAVHAPHVAQIRSHLAARGQGMSSVRACGFRVWVPGRYKRIPAPNGVAYRDSADLVAVCPDVLKRYAECGFGDRFDGRVKRGWVLIPCSGQVYGIIGTPVIASSALESQVVSNHVMRIASRKNAEIPAGYLAVALGHPVLGRPLVKALAFGSSVPELDPADVAALNVVRLDERVENSIAERAVRSADANAEADGVELQMAEKASALIAEFIAG